ncbi:MAG: HEPN domain-containing protein [Candidatus Eremiobacterota bacterium]
MIDEVKEIILRKMTRAYEALEEAEMMAGAKHWNTCVNRLYYSCFYSVSALLMTENLLSSKHTGVRSFFNNHFVKKGLINKELGKLYNKLFDFRHESDYDDFVLMKEEDVMPLIPDVKIFIETLQDFIDKCN